MEDDSCLPFLLICPYDVDIIILFKLFYSINKGGGSEL